MPPPPELMDDVIAETLLRLPPDEPEHLFRAALVCKPWLRTLCDPAFLRRYRAFHGSPPLLGLLHQFQALDARHGRVLLTSPPDGAAGFLVWDPVTGGRHGLPWPPQPDIMSSLHSATVICAAAAGCDHLDCHGGGAFRVVLVGSDFGSNTIWASVYSSETRSWSTPTSLHRGHNDHGFYTSPTRAILIGEEIFCRAAWDSVVKYDCVNNCLSLVNPRLPQVYHGWSTPTLLLMDDGNTLGLAGIKDSSLCLWSRKVNSEKDAEWAQCRVIELVKIIPGADEILTYARVIGFAEGVGVISLNTNLGLFTIELKSGRATKVAGAWVYHSVLPYLSFYTPDRGRLSSLARALVDGMA
ncbi:hypothetical protein ACP4OV_011975 [Aristida adscensionis]